MAGPASNPNGLESIENPSGGSSTILTMFQELQTTLSAGNLAKEIIEKKKSLFLEGLTSNIFAGGSFDDFKNHQNSEGSNDLERSDYHARLATKDAEFKRIYTGVQSLTSAGLVLSDLNSVGLGSGVSSASQTVTDNEKKMVALKKQLINKSYGPTIGGYVQHMKQTLGADVIGAGEYAKMNDFIMKFLDPSTASVTLPGDKKIVFKKKDLSFQKVNGTAISSLDDHSLTGDTGFGSNLFVPHFVLDTEQTDPEIAKLLMSGSGAAASAGTDVNLTDRHLKFLPYVFISAALGDSALATQKIRESLGLSAKSEDTYDEYIERESTGLDTKIDYEGFSTKFNMLSGDSGITFTEKKLNPSESFLYFNDYGEGYSELPGGGNNRVKASLTQVGDVFKIQLLDTTDLGMEGEQKEFTYPINGVSLDALINNRGGSQNIVRAKQSASLSGITQGLSYLGGSKNLNGFDVDDVHSAWDAGHVVRGDSTKGHYESERDLSSITHLGYPKGGSEYAFYDIDQGSDGVTVSYQNRSKTMDYTTFALFVLDKGLLPFSDSEYETANKSIDTPKAGSVFKNGFRKFVSIGTAITMLKSIPDAVMANLKKGEELRAAEAEVWLFDKFGFVPGVDKFDAQKKLDGLVLGEIEQRKNQLMGMDVEGNSATSEKKEGIGQVKDDLHSLRFGNKSHMRTLAGDFLYVLELNELYEGDLGEFSSQHIWVQKLLGPKHYAAFRKKFHKQYAEIRNLPTNSADKRDALMKMELNYIAEQTKGDKELQRVYGTKFFKTIEDYVEGKMGGAADAVKKDSSNRPFSQVFLAANSSLKKISAPKFIGFLEIALSKVETKAERDKVNLMILQYYTTGTNHKALKLNADKLASMGRRYGNPLLKLANNVNAPRIVLNLADALAKPGNELSGALDYGGKKGGSGEYIEIHNFSLLNSRGESTNRERLKQTKSRRGANGTEFMNAIYFNNTSLFTSMGRLGKKTRTDKEEQQYQDLKYYYSDAVLGNEGSTLGDSESAHPSSPLYSDSSLNLTGAGFRELMIRPYSSTTNTFKDTSTQLLWKNLTKKIKNIDSQISTAPDEEKEYLLHLVTSKYIDFFGTLMSQSNFTKFQDALIKGKGGRAKKQINEYAFDKKYHKESSMEQGFKAFANFFSDHAGKISKYNAKQGIMSSAFDEVNGDGSESNYRNDVEKQMNKNKEGKKDNVIPLNVPNKGKNAKVIPLNNSTPLRKAS